MPIYEFKCPQCGERYRELFKITDEPRPVCTRCSIYMKRVYSFMTTNMPTQAGQKMDRRRG